MENYCFVENTYWLEMGQPIPDNEDLHLRQDKELQYYQVLESSS